MRRSAFLLVLLAGAAVHAAAQQKPLSHSDLIKKLGSDVQWHTNDPVILEEGRNRQEVANSKKEHKDFDRAAALTQALAEAGKRKQLVLLYVPRILSGKNGRQAYRPGIMDNHMMSVLFSDPDCVSIVNNRFVPVRLICDAKVADMIKITAPETLEPAILFVRPDGTIYSKIDRIRTFNSAWFKALLSLVLQANPQLAQAPASLDAVTLQTKNGALDPVRFVQEHLKTGFFRKAAVAAMSLAAEDQHAKHKTALVLAQAQALRAIGRMSDAIDLLSRNDEAVLEAAGKNRNDPALGDFYCELGRNLLLLGLTDEAAAAFVKVGQGPRRAEAQYHLGLCDFFDRRTGSAIRRWKDAASASADNPYAWRAAANLVDGPDRTPIGPATHGFEDPFWRNLSGPTAGDTTFARTLEKTKDIARDAVAYLLRMQRENGGWTDSRYAYWGAPDYTPNVWIATSALAMAALLDWRDLDPENIDAAIERGERYIFDRRRIAFDLNEEVYAHAYRLIYLAKRWEMNKSEADREDCINKMHIVIRDLAGIQKEGDTRRPAAEGAWAHEYPNPFTTAAALDALHRAETCGATVPRRLFVGGAKALLATRDKDGAYAYSNGRKVDVRPETREMRLKDSMGRSPVAEAALIWARSAAGSQENLTTAMKHFWTYMPRLQKVRMCDFHTDGQLAGFFFWHVMLHTSEAIKALPAAEQAEHRARLHALLVKIGEIDGSFIDSHEIGKSYGTAMGLITLKSISPPKAP